MSKVRIIQSQVGGTIIAPSSKSYAQRALIGAMLARGTTVLRNITLCDDVVNVLKVIRNLGTEVELTGYAVALGAKVGLEDSEIGLGAEVELTGCAVALGAEVELTGCAVALGAKVGLEDSEIGLGAEVELTGCAVALGAEVELTGCAVALGAEVGLEDSEIGLGVEVELTDGEVECRKTLDIVIKGVISPQSPLPNILNIGESGLAARLFTPIAALLTEPITIVGEGSILSRPIGMMKRPLEQLGAKFNDTDGFLPLVVKGPIRGGEITLDGSDTSQFMTGLLTALPLAYGNSVIKVKNLKSIAYVDMTVAMLKLFGVEVSHEKYETFRIKGGQTYRSIDYSVEGDWSGVSCMLVAGAIAGEVTVGNLNPESIQPDRVIVEILKEGGAKVSWSGNRITVRSAQLKGFSFDATNCPDLFPALVVLAAYCEGRSTIIGTKRLIHKESNRMVALVEEFGKLGVRIDVSKENTMTVEGCESASWNTPRSIKGGAEGDVTRSISGIAEGGALRIAAKGEDGARSISKDALEGVDDDVLKSVEVDSRGDHRMAMALAVFALNCGCEVVIDGAESVSKSYPEFWRDLDRITKK